MHALRRANIKVSSTETGAIFGNIVYESTGYAERSVVVLNDIHIDIMDYISPASCPDVQFRSMWAEFEWENKARMPALVPSPPGLRPQDFLSAMRRLHQELPCLPPLCHASLHASGLIRGAGCIMKAR